jgi:hypothetical protein
MEESTTSRGARYWADDEGIVHGAETSSSTLHLEDALEAMALIRKLADGRKVGLLMDITKLGAMAREARSHFSSPAHADLLLGVALVVRSPLSRAIGNFFLGLNRSVVRTRLFSDDKAALEWLRTIIRESRAA